MRKVTIRLDQQDMALVRQLGGGRATDGVRQALAMVRNTDAAIARVEDRLATIEAKINGVGKLTQAIHGYFEQAMAERQRQQAQGRPASRA